MASTSAEANALPEVADAEAKALPVAEIEPSLVRLAVATEPVVPLALADCETPTTSTSAVALAKLEALAKAVALATAEIDPVLLLVRETVAVWPLEAD